MMVYWRRLFLSQKVKENQRRKIPGEKLYDEKS